MRTVSFLLAAVLATCAVGARAADSRDPDWPCVQAKVPELSVVAMWAGPPLDDAAKADAAALADRWAVGTAMTRILDALDAT